MRPHPLCGRLVAPCARVACRAVSLPEGRECRCAAGCADRRVPQHGARHSHRAAAHERSTLRPRPPSRVPPPSPRVRGRTGPAGWSSAQGESGWLAVCLFVGLFVCVRVAGIYLPLLWDAHDTFRQPLCIGFTRGHFSSLARDGSSQTPVTALCLCALAAVACTRARSSVGPWRFRRQSVCVRAAAHGSSAKRAMRHFGLCFTLRSERFHPSRRPARARWRRRSSRRTSSADSRACCCRSSTTRSTCCRCVRIACV